MMADFISPDEEGPPAEPSAPKWFPRAIVSVCMCGIDVFRVRERFFSGLELQQLVGREIRICCVGFRGR